MLVRSFLTFAKLSSLALLFGLSTMASAKPKRAKKKVRSSEKAVSQPLDFGGGIGFFNFFPPQPTVMMSYDYKRLINGGIEFGYMVIPLEKFSGSSTYVGLDLKTFPFKSSWFAGLSYGQRSFSIQTKSNFTVNETDNEIIWSSEISQTVLALKVGIMSMSKGGDSITFSGGLIKPLSSTFKIENEPSTIPGLPAGELEAERESKSDDIKAITHATLPLLELRYTRYFDWL